MLKIKPHSLTILFILIAVAYFLLLLYSPRYGDDLWYLLGFQDYFEGRADSFPFQQYIESLKYRYAADNIRFTTVITTFAVVAPKWLSSILFGVAIYITLRMMALICGVKRGDFTLGVFVATGYVVFLPWFERMFSVSFALNYIVPTALLTSYIYLFVNCRKYSSRQMIAIYILAFFMGWIHEGFSIPLLAGLALYATAHHFSIPRRQWIMAAWLIPGILLITTAPGFWYRLSCSIGEPVKFTSVLFYNSMFLILVALIIIYLILYKKKRQMTPTDISYLLIILGIAITSIVIHSRNSLGVRVGWASMVSSIMGVIIMFRYLYSGWNKRLWTAFSVALAALIITHLSVAIIEMRKALHEWNDVIALYKQSNDGLVFYNFTTEAQSPLIALKKANNEYFVYNWDCYLITKYYSDENGEKQIRVVPADLYRLDESKLKEVPGDLPFYTYKGHLVAKGKRKNRLNCNVYFGNKKYNLDLYLVPFTTSDGQRWVYAYPLRAYVPSHFNPITRITVY